MKLSIDTTNNLATTIRLDKHVLTHDYETPRGQDALSAIHEILSSHNKSIKDITEIEVNPGPGSFTGTRVGVSIANALGFTLNTPVNGKKPPITPVYSKPPNITKPK